jgi:hypothetical protein
MEEEFVVALELGFLASNIKKKVCDVLNKFLFFLRNFEEKKIHNMLYLMLDPRFKKLCSMSSFIGLEFSRAIVEEIDKKKLCISCCQNVTIICTPSLKMSLLTKVLMMIVF